jgi:isopentenyldiphosphate isomerase
VSAPIQIVDEDDKPVRAATKQEAWEQGLLHRVVRIMIENSKGELLLQMRAPDKDIFPSCWDDSSAGHVDAGEDYDVAAYRELEEELGITGQKLEEVGKFRSNETIDSNIYNRFAKVYRLKLDIRLSDLRLEQGKVTAARWFTVDEVKALVKEHPEQVTDGLRQVVEWGII